MARIFRLMELVFLKRRHHKHPCSKVQLVPAAGDGDLERGGATADVRQVDAAIAGARSAINARAGDWTRLPQDLIRIPSCFESEHAIVARVCEHAALD